jgi:hypothetical protein
MASPERRCAPLTARAPSRVRAPVVGRAARRHTRSLLGEGIDFKLSVQVGGVA